LRDIPRILFAYKGRPRDPIGADQRVRANPDKFNYLVSKISLIMLNGLPEAGQDRKTTRAVSQQDLAECAGLNRRETVTRRLGNFAEPVEVETKQYFCIVDSTTGKVTKRKDSKIHAQAKCTVANTDAGYERYTVEQRAIGRRNPRVMLSRKRQFCKPNRYGDGLPESTVVWHIHDKHTQRDQSKHFLSKEAAAERAKKLEAEHGSQDRFEVVEREREEKKCYHPATLDQLLADPRQREWWDDTVERGWANASHKGIFLWIWDKRLMDPEEPSKPLGDIPRLLMTYYGLKGLFDFGETDPMQAEVARACGISTSEVYLGNRKLAKLGDDTVFRVVPRGGKRRDDGSFKPAESTLILFLPLRTISHADAQEERERFLFHLAELQMHGKDVEVYKVFDRLLRQYDGSEKRWKTFYRQLRTDLQAAGLPVAAIDRLIPQQPPG
jgi:hypothetical protein